MSETLAWLPGDGEMARRIREHDWAATPLGPISDWPSALRAAVAFILDHPLPMVVAWGETLTTIYNDAYLPLIEEERDALGRPFIEVWQEARDVIAPQIDRALDGQAIHFERHRFLLGRGETQREAFFDYSLSPLRDEHGQISGVLNTAVETTQRVRAEAALQASQTLLLSLSDAFRSFGEPKAEASANAACQLLGEHLGAHRVQYTLVQNISGYDVGTPLGEFIQPGVYLPDSENLGVLEDLSHPTLRAGKALVLCEMRSASSSGAIEHTDFSANALAAAIAVPLIKSGELVAVMSAQAKHRRQWTEAEVALTEEVAERTWAAVQEASAQTGLRTSETRFRTLVEGIPQLVWRAGRAGEWTWSSPQWQSFTGQSIDESSGWGWLDAVHPEDRARARAAWNDATANGELDGDWRLLHIESGKYRWFQTRATPVRDGDRVIEWLGTSTDVQDIMELREHQKILLAELQHRVRNLLAMMRSIVRKSTDSHDTVEDYVAHLTGRIDAMGRTQVLLTRASGASVDLENLIRDELSHVADEDQISIGGPDVKLSGKAAEILTMAVHELATNSIKYGALGGEGKLDVHWSTQQREDREWLALTWQEPTARPDGAAHRGFGMDLIEGRLPYELHGEGSLTFADGSVRAEIAFPLSSGASILEANTPQGDRR